MDRRSCSLAAVLLLLVLSITTNVLSTTTTKDIPATASSISHQFSASPPCYDTSSGEISTEGRFNYTVSIADVHGDAEALLHSLWISRNYIAAGSSGTEISFQDFKEVIAKETERAQADGRHERFSGCSDVLLVQVRSDAPLLRNTDHINVFIHIIRFPCFASNALIPICLFRARQLTRGNFRSVTSRTVALMCSKACRYSKLRLAHCSGIS